MVGKDAHPTKVKLEIAKFNTYADDFAPNSHKIRLGLSIVASLVRKLGSFQLKKS